ncbi:MAG: hypothetical protein HGB23_07795 [Chlorobiaceae bacterium]|nr:hypothetical protein [Chlorobiaceae bacterium]
MKKQTGLWIDHKEAIVVSIEGDSVVVQRVESGAESHFKPSGGWKASGTSVAQSISKEQSAEESRKHQYHAFYKKVIALLGDSAGIALFGPGEAKIELAKEISKIHLVHEKVKAVETSARMTEKQFIATVKAFFTA